MNQKNICWIILLILVLAFAVNAQTFEKTIKLQAPKNGESLFTYVPFEVPQNTKSLSFSYEYNKKSGANRLEFGVFETGFSGQNNDKNGLRGWSGSIRDNAFIAENKATYGYKAGKIPAGKWYFIVGLPKIVSEGVELTLKVKFNQIDEAPLKKFEAEFNKKFTYAKYEKQIPVKTNGLTWYAGDLHAHSFHGDGTWSVKGILDSAKSNNLDFVALTEHNIFTYHDEIDAEAKNYPNMLILRGQEVTTYGAHINVWGLPSGKWVEFRVLPNLKASAELIAKEAHELGALASINHPTMNCGGCSWTYDKDWSSLDSVEIWNATWDQDDDDAIKIWDGFLQQGRVITAVGSTDSHYPPSEPSTYPINLTLGNPSVVIGSKSLTKEGLFEGIRNGRVVVTENPRLQIKFTADKKYTIGDKIKVSKDKKVKLNISLTGFPNSAKLLVISDGKTIKETEITKKDFSLNEIFIPAKDTYVRLEIRDKDNKMLGLTNPIYFRLK